MVAGVAALVGLVVIAAALLTSGVLGREDAPVDVGPVVGTWEQAPALQRIRGSTSAIALPDGKVAAVGGGLGSVPLAATELLDPDAQAWTPTGDLTEARRGHRAVALEDGRLLVAGGFDGSDLLASAEVYDPAAGTWSPTGPMAEPRLGHTMTVLADGAVLVTGGTGETGAAGQGSQSIQPSASAELYEPDTGIWESVGEMLVPRFEHTATPLPDGRVLIAGGQGRQRDEVAPVADVELYDPNTRTFSRTAPMLNARTDHAAAALDDGRVLVVGGDAGDAAIATAELFEPARGSWSEVAPMRQPRRGHSVTLLEDGTVLAAAGEFFVRGSRTSLASAERYDPAEDVWANAGEMGCPRSEHGAARLADGTVLLAAGDAAFPGNPPIAQSCVDVYSPASG
ncbi:MAG TPA: kelch repeat-containing protein [Nitriliruptorales bacterium]|nr:kelch repeat-containing protein [Nitriliruptorales bacterium]